MYLWEARDFSRVRLHNIAQALMDYHTQRPELRFGQIVVNLLGRDPYLFYEGDKEALQRICTKIENHSEVNK